MLFSSELLKMAEKKMGEMRSGMLQTSQGLVPKPSSPSPRLQTFGFMVESSLSIESSWLSLLYREFFSPNA